MQKEIRFNFSPIAADFHWYINDWYKF